ncbi:enoyl-CoA hydratase/isomerase family protein [Pseudonocardia parietis]|uniref:Enoyl-CoA hydratase/carnithine racemase n=1 Tax=Pseudonocardia parietis TaxID=570936 RepID=A0ABS4VMK2_9PSEU|nr:enoyl-CoA hydratase/isomerase family protein [Pseudonocardia parietis]MBP2364794.1 enoyl-CoA hydratase/carnithine racemase [Pseudonocardia parietis]
MPASTNHVVQCTVRGSAAWLTLDRPDVHNALSLELLDELAAGLDRAERDPAVRSVVIAARGPSFCAGADLAMARALHGESDLPRFLHRAAEVFDALVESPRPVIAAVQGGVIAGGLELVLACDLVVATEDATFADGHARYGMFPAAGGTTRLPRRIGANRAKQLLFTAQRWDAERMREAGLVTEVVPAGELERAVEALTERIGRHSPTGIAGMKRLVDTGAGTSPDRAAAQEMAACEAYASTDDFAEGLAAFAQGREPRFTGR